MREIEPQLAGAADAPASGAVAAPPGVAKTAEPSLAAVLVLLALVGATLLFNRWFSPNPVDLSQLGRVVQRFVEITYLTSPWFLAGLAGIFLLERLRPAIASQRVFGHALAYDAIWFVAEVFTNSGLLLWYGSVLWNVYDSQLSFLRVEAIRELSAPARFAIAALVGDFLGWFHHWLRHRYAWLWYLHSLHHSQTELNPLTDLRYHFVEYMFTRAISAVPMFSLGFAAPAFVAWELGKTLFTRFYHSNIRTDLGPLRWVLVTPQSHRIHHSYAPEHHDCNFGVLLSVWDRIFGTHCDARGEYPPTGIPDPEFPLERKEQGWRMLLMPVAQLWYPFRMIGRDVRAALRG
jgi:sterol desaturase/sphingolipid hydroxylase (fatty acid hydroxylase superfamily)